MNNVALFYSIIDTAEFDSVQSPRRRRMEREAKAKVVASVWGAEFSQFLAALAVLPRLIWKKRLNSSPNKRDDLCRCFCLHPSSMPAAEKFNKCPIKKVFCNFYSQSSILNSKSLPFLTLNSLVFFVLYSYYSPPPPST